MSQASSVISLPVEKLTFEADDFHGEEIITRYDENRTLVVFCQHFLECSPKQMKKKLAALEASDELQDDVVQRLINDFEACADGYKALSVLFDSAAARMIVVHRGLI